MNTSLALHAFNTLVTTRHWDQPQSHKHHHVCEEECEVNRSTAMRSGPIMGREDEVGKAEDFVSVF